MGADSFDLRTAPVVGPGPRHSGSNRFKENARRHLLWPAWAWRVVAPAVDSRSLNIIEKAVLGLLDAGTRDPDKAGAVMCIAPDLVRFILARLTDRALVDGGAEVTERGRAALEDALDVDAEWVVGYVFQDPFDGSLWPAFVEGRQLRYWDRQTNPRGYPVIEMGTTGRSRPVEPFVVLPPSATVAEAQPDPEEIITAVRLQRRTDRLQRRARTQQVDELHSAADNERTPPFEIDEELLEFDSATPGVPSTRSFRRISFIDQAPEPVLLLADVFLPESGEPIWYASDPFGHGISARLRRAIEQRIASNTGLRKVVQSLLVTLPEDERERVEHFYQRLEALADQHVEEQLTVEGRSSTLWPRLVEMERALLEVLQLPHSPPDKLEDVLLRGQKVLERLFKEVRKPYSDDIYKSVPWKDKDSYRQHIEFRTIRLGTATPLPGSYLGVQPGKLRPAYFGRGSLRPLLHIAVLQADRHLNHPLRAAIRQAPDLIHRIDAIAGARDAGGHDQDARNLRLEDVEHHVRTIYEVVRLVLALPLHSNPATEMTP